MDLSQSLRQAQSAIVSGGKTQADTQALHRARLRLLAIGQNLRRDAAASRQQAQMARTDLLPLPLCPAGSPLAAAGNPREHLLHEHEQNSAQNLSAACGQSDVLSDRLQVLADRCESMARRLAQVIGLYSEGESSVSRLIGTLLACLPPRARAALLLAPSLAASGLTHSRSRVLNAEGASLYQQADRLVQPGMRALAQCFGRPGRMRTSVNDAARLLSPLSAGAQDLYQGDRLTVTEAHPRKGGGIGESHDVASTLANLDRLGNLTASKVPYGTVALQKYVEDDGTNHWLLLVPGTRGERDTPIGWAQNIELMSSDNDQRLHADSARLALKALEEGGVRPGESVVVAGHSQGGIVAASLAAGATGYSITHIVTAGSPIAGHPIPEKTWVTSVEDRGEVVSRLDGKDNPRRRTWVTVEGRLSRSLSHQIPGTPVQPTGGSAQLAHGMNYQRSTWEDAQGLGSTAIEDSDRHLSRQLRGRLASTRYFTGRMSH